MNIKKLRNKKIGKKFQITFAPYTHKTTRLYVYEYNERKKGWVKHIAGEYHNQKALGIYNSTKTVKNIKNLLGRK